MLWGSELLQQLVPDADLFEDFNEFFYLSGLGKIFIT